MELSIINLAILPLKLAYTSFVIGNFAIEQNIPINRSYTEPFNQFDLPDNIDITNILTSEINKKYTSAFGNINLGFVRSAIARILFLVILINIFSIVPQLIKSPTENGGEDKEEEKKKNLDKEEEKKKNFFADLILTALLLAIILTLTPEGDIGAIKLNMSIDGAISILLIIISFILVYLFKKNDINKLIEKRQ